MRHELSRKLPLAASGTPWWNADADLDRDRDCRWSAQQAPPPDDALDGGRRVDDPLPHRPGSPERATPAPGRPIGPTVISGALLLDHAIHLDVHRDRYTCTAHLSLPR